MIKGGPFPRGEPPGCSPGPREAGAVGKLLLKQGRVVVRHLTEFLLLQRFLFVSAPVLPVVEAAFDLPVLVKVRPRAA